MPKISVVIPLYNKEREVERCVRSVLAQTFTDFEMLVINDGSRDRGPELVQQIDDPRLKLIDKPNGGVASARNMGIELARAELIAFLDGDDEWCPDHLKTIDGLRKSAPEAGSYFTAYRVDRGGGWTRDIKLPSKHMAGNMLKNYYNLPLGYWLPSASAFAKCLFDRCGYYREMFAEDADFWFRAAAFAPVAYSPRATAVWHVDADNRRCNDEALRKPDHDPATLNESLALIQASDIPEQVKRDAAAYLARHELRPILQALAEGNQQSANALLSYWRSHFGELPASARLAFHLPAPFLRMRRSLLEKARKSMTAMAYLRARLT